MRRSISFRPDARTDLIGIWSYSVEHWSVDQADAYIREIHSSIRRAADNPNLGSEASELYPELRRVKSGSHVIYYVADAAALDVVRILHGRRDPASLI